MSTQTPSSATAGFFQPLPVVKPAYTSSSHSSGGTSQLASSGDDPILSRLLNLYLPSPTSTHITKHLHALSRLTLSPPILTHNVLAERHQPTLHPLTTFGAPNMTPSQLHTNPSWRYMSELQAAQGIIAHSYSAPSTDANVVYNRRVYAFLLNHIWDPSSAGVTCPAAMTDGAAVLLRAQLADSTVQGARREVFSDAYARLTSLDPKEYWSAGQWMTERSGGSDVRGTESIARSLGPQEQGGVDAVGNPLGEWSVSGFKWFSSATDADCAVLLAKTAGGGGRVSCFFAPTRRRGEGGAGQEEIVMNGVRISRLKNKLGTKSLPTAELELNGMRAWLLGKEGEGTKVISALLNITRLHTAKGGVAAWGRGLAIARAWTRARPIKDPMAMGEKRLLSENRQHVRWMAEETVKYRAYASFYMFGVALLGVSEIDGLVSTTKADALGLVPGDKAGALALLRLLTPVMKQACSLASVQGLRECMESLGGVGYCENDGDDGVLNVAKLFRDANVNPIWEGTTSVLAEDLLRALRVGSRKGVETLDRLVGAWLKSVLNGEAIKRLFAKETEEVMARYEKLKVLLATKSEEQLLWKGRVVVRLMADICCTVLLMADAAVDEDNVAIAVARRWAVLVGDQEREAADWLAEADMDRRIFLGDEEPGWGSGDRAQAKL